MTSESAYGIRERAIHSIPPDLTRMDGQTHSNQQANACYGPLDHGREVVQVSAILYAFPVYISTWPHGDANGIRTHVLDIGSLPICFVGLIVYFIRCLDDKFSEVVIPRIKISLNFEVAVVNSKRCVDMLKAWLFCVLIPETRFNVRVTKFLGQL